MRRFLLPLVLFLSLPAVAQPLQIREVVVPDSPRPRAGEMTTVALTVRVENTGRVERFVIVGAQPDGASEGDRVMSPSRIPSGATATLSVPVAINLQRVSPAPTSVRVTVRAYANATTVADETTVEIPVESAARSTPISVAATTVRVEIPPIREPTISSLDVRIHMGHDDLRFSQSVYVDVMDPEGRVLKSRLGSDWPSGSLQTVSVMFDEPIPASRIHRVVFKSRGGVYGIATNTYDNFDFERIDLVSDGRVLASRQGTPWNRFTGQHPDRPLQVRAPNPNESVRELGLSILTGEDDVRGSSHVTAQAFGRDGRALSDLVRLTSGGAGWDGGSHRIVPLPLRGDVPIHEIGSIVIEHESVQRNPFDSADNWDLQMVEVLSAYTATLREGAWSVLHTAQGAPRLHRFDGDHRRLEIRLD